MSRVPITVWGFHCDRCGHEWVPREIDQEPKVCPKCKSPYWNTPKKEPAQMTYEDFSQRIKAVLAESGKPLTWTEIRTAAKLRQRFPNNQWVHRMERDIGLVRERDSRGIMLWKLRQEG